MMKWMSSAFFCFVILISFSCDSDKETIYPPLSALGEEELKQQIAKYPDSLLLVEKLIQSYREAGAYDSALAITQQAINRAPNIHGLWGIKATLDFENGDTVNAIKSFEHAINIFPLPVTNPPP